MQHTQIGQVKSHDDDKETCVMPLLKVWLQDILEETIELTADTAFKAPGYAQGVELLLSMLCTKHH
jgi:hypothetical protein